MPLLSLCSVCPGLTSHCRQIPSDGPVPARFLFIGPGPFKSENKTGVPYSGLAGEELTNLYLPLAGLHRHHVHIAYASVCYDGQDKAPHDTRVKTCGEMHLPRLINRVKPEVVVLMGGTVCRNLADFKIRLDTHHGRPFYGSILSGAWTGWVWPSYEPGLGIKDTGRMTQLMEDFTHLGEWDRGEWIAPGTETEINTEVSKDYGLCRDRSDVYHYCRLAAGRTIQAAVDTERHGERSWSLQFSHTPPTGRLLLAPGAVYRGGSAGPSAQSALDEFQRWVIETQAEFGLHFAGQDLDALERMGVWPASFRDTMQEAYHQCSLPQGLKPLAYRLLGVTMRSWEDVVWPASVRAAVEWIEDALALAGTGLQNVEVEQMKRGKCADCGHLHSRGPCKRDNCGCVSTRMTFKKVTYTPSVTAQILKHVLTYTARTEESEKPYDPWKKLPEMRAEGLRGKKPEEWEWEYLESELGPMPILGIGNCELDEAVQYGCSDADHTLQVEKELEKRRGDDRWRVDEYDWDKEDVHEYV